jgi:inorganic pyrophosphatase
MAKKKAALADPTRLKPFDSADKQMLRVVIETPKGSRNKFAFNADDHVFELKKVLPAGMAFPYDFGFVPSTLADDGDPVDVLVLMDEPAFPGCVLKCRPIGVIQGEQCDKEKKVRNDRIIAVEKDAHSWADIKSVNDLGKQFVRELEEFFVDYHRLSGEQYRVLALKGRAQARKLVKSGMATAMNQSLIRFIIGGAIISAFAIIADVLKPKSFAGLFGAAPSVALATLTLTVVSDGASYAATEGRSMMAGAIAFFVYASLVSFVLMRYKFRAVVATLCLIPVWLGVAGSVYYFVWARS